MDSYERTEAVIRYVEDNILDVDYAEISRIAYCPLGLYQRIFSYIAGISIADYIKRRRLSLSAIELLEGDAKVVDIAVKYGYQSHAAFTRAFREQIGVAPSQAHRNAAHVRDRLYARLVIQDPYASYRVEKGRRIMAKLTRIEYVSFGGYKMVGKEVRTKNGLSGVGEFWQHCFAEGMYEPLIAMKEYLPSEIDEYVGYMNDYNKHEDSFNYVVGMFMKADVPVPEGYVGYDVPHLTVAKAWIEGEENEIYNNAYFLITEAMQQNGYEVDRDNFYWCEVYTDRRFGIPKSKGAKVLTLDYYIPCIKHSVFSEQYDLA
jgi:AraC family transcriptional regulator